jgi:hypothetical protein
VEANWVVRRRGSHSFLDNHLTGGGDVGLTLPPPFTSQEDFWYSFLLKAERIKTKMAENGYRRTCLLVTRRSRVRNYILWERTNVTSRPLKLYDGVELIKNKCCCPGHHNTQLPIAETTYKHN